MNRFLYIVVGMVITVILVLEPVQAGDAGVNSPFTAGAGARALGLGGGFTSMADDASTVFYNPAGLAVLDNQEVTGMHMTLFEGTLYDYVSWAYPTLALGGFGIAFMRIGTGDIIKREQYVDMGTFDYSYTQIILAYGRSLRDGLTVGANLKIVNQSLERFSDYGVGFDLGVLKEFNHNIRVGVMFRDLVPATLKLKTTGQSSETSITGETLPVSVVLGSSINYLRIHNRAIMNASFELEKTEQRSVKLHTGAEFVIDNTYAIRAGYDRDNVTFGAGVVINRLKFDYAYKFIDYLNDSHRFSVSYMIGLSIPEQLRQREVAEQQKNKVLLADERQRQFSFYKNKATEFYRVFQLDSALTYYQRALAFNEDDPGIKRSIAAIEAAQDMLKEHDQKIHDSERELKTATAAYYVQAQSFFAKKYYPAALDMLGLILDIDPENAEALSLKRKIKKAVAAEIAAGLKQARKAQRDGDYVKAIEGYTRILYLDPNNKTAKKEKQEVVDKLDLSRHLNLGIDLFRSGYYAEARQKFLFVLSVKPDEPVAKDYINRIDVALAHPPTLEKIQRNRVIWQYYLDGLKFMRNKEYQKAIDAWEKVLEVYPNNESTLDNLEQARLRLKLEQEKPVSDTLNKQ